MKVSVVITAYNIEKYIDECINSILNQTHKDLDIFVVDDKSTDDTLNHLKKFKKTDKRVHVIENKVNVGAGESRFNGINAAFVESDSTHIIIVDGDDWLSPDFIETLAKKAEETGADIVSGGISVKYPDGVTECTLYGDIETTGIERITKFWKDRIVFMNNKLISKSIHAKVPYCKRRYIEDTPVIIPLMYFANKVVYVNNAGYFYRMRNDSLTHQTNAVKTAVYRAICAKELINFFTQYQPDYLEYIDLGNAYAKELRTLKNSNLTVNDIAEFKDDFNLLGVMLISDLNI